MPHCTVVIPVYKSSDSIVQIAKAFDQLNEHGPHRYELIFVNDCPGYGITFESLDEIKKKHGFVKVLELRKNQGQHTALLVGISKAKGDYVVTMDDDLQHPVGEVPKILNVMITHPTAKAAFAVPGILNKKHSLWRNFGSYLNNKVDLLFLKKPKGLIKSPFRIMTADIANFIVKNRNATPSISSMLIAATADIINIEVAHEKRAYGKGNYSLPRLISLSLNNVIHYSSLPLKAVGIAGVAGFLGSVVFIAVTLVRKLFFGIAFPGYASTVSLISLFGGLQLLGIGIIGEYLIRIIREQQKPDLDDLLQK